MAEKRVTFIYAVDSDVLEDYFYPLLDRPSYREEEAPLFLGDGGNSRSTKQFKTFTRRLYATLSRFLIDRICVYQPAILLPGHAREANDIYDAIVDKLRKYQDTVHDVRHELETALAALRTDPKGENDAAYPSLYSQGLWEKLNAFERPLYASNKFLDLLGGEHILAADAVPVSRHYSNLERAQDGEHPFRIPPANYDPVTRRFAERLNYDASTQDETELAATAALESLETADRRALVRLFQINRRLGESYRLILVTPNKKLSVAAAKIRDFPGNHSFADRYIRHPNSFLLDCGIFDHDSRNAEDSQRPQLAWLDMLLSAFDRDIGSEDIDLYTDFDQFHLKPVLLQRAFDAQELNPDAHAGFVASWYRYLGRAVDLGLASDLNTYESLIALSNAAEEDIDAPLSELRDIINERTEDSWRNFFETAARAGFQLIGDTPSSSEIIKRALPIAVFTHHLEAQDACQVLVSGLDINKAREQLLDRISKLEIVDQTGYTRALTYSLLFAFSDRWEIAELLAQRAIKIYCRELERVPLDAPGRRYNLAANGRISGREAYFLSAAYSRVLSSSERELNRVGALLSKAEASLRSEHAYEEAAGIKSPQSAMLTEIRFRSERISLQISRHFVARYCQERGDQIGTGNGALPDLSYVVDDLKNCLAESAKLSNEWLRSRIDMNLLTNLFMAAFLMKSSIGETPFSSNPAEALAWTERAFELNGGVKYWRTIGHLPVHEPGISAVPSRLDRLACVYGISLWGKEGLGETLPSLSFLEREVRLMQFLLETHPRLILATPYDEARYAEVLSLTQKNLDALFVALK